MEAGTEGISQHYSLKTEPVTKSTFGDREVGPEKITLPMFRTKFLLHINYIGSVQYGPTENLVRIMLLHDLSELES